MALHNTGDVERGDSGVFRVGGEKRGKSSREAVCMSHVDPGES